MYRTSVDFKDYSTGYFTAWNWQVWNNQTGEYDSIGITQDLPGFDLDNTDWYTVDIYDNYVYEIRLDVETEFYGYTKDRTLMFNPPPS
jgi:hypothetical protein